MNYKAKAQDSFRTKLNLFLYHYVSSKESKNLDLELFNGFEITSKLIHEYTTIYWQMDYNDKIGGLTIRAIYQAIDNIHKEHALTIKEWESYYVQNIFPDLFPFDNFQHLTSQQACYYCGITPNEINKLADLGRLYKKKDRGWNLEIDRLDSNREYSPENCVMCCYWCNNAKTDEFTSEEFKQIAKGIRNVWDQRLRADRFISADRLKLFQKGDH